MRGPLPYVCLCLFASLPMAAQRTITLEEAVQAAIEKSPTAAAERTLLEEAAGGLRQAEGAFQPRFTFQTLIQRATTPTGSVLEGPGGRLDQHLSSGGVNFSQRLPWQGMRLEAGYETNRITTNNPFFSLNPYYQPRLSTALVVPLARGRRTDEARTELRVSRRRQQQSAAQFASGLLQLSARVEAAYWDWVAARQSLRNAEMVRSLADESRQSTQRMVEAGDVSEAELLGAVGQLQRAEEALADMRGAFAQSEAALKSLLAADSQDAIWDEHLLPAAEQNTVLPAPASDLINQALQRRPELEALVSEIDIQQQRRQLAQEGLKPRIDLRLGYRSSGLAGREILQDPVFPGLDLRPPRFLVGSTATAASQVWQNAYPTYDATIEIELPLFRKQAQGETAVASAGLNRARLQRRQQEIQVALEVRQALTALQASRQRIQAARQAVDASRQRLESETRLFREGLSNNLNLNIRQNELAESQRLAVASERAFNLAAAELRRATAATFEDFRIRLQ